MEIFHYFTVFVAFVFGGFWRLNPEPHECWLSAADPAPWKDLIHEKLGIEILILLNIFM
jgi:hypothetical protein